MVNTLSYCLTVLHELANFHILVFSLKQFEALGKKHLQAGAPNENIPANSHALGVSLTPAG